MVRLAVFVDLPPPASMLVRQVLEVFSRHFSVVFNYEVQAPDLTIGKGAHCDIALSEAFLNRLDNAAFSTCQLMPDEPLIRHTDGRPDYLGTSIFMLNGMQEQTDDAAVDDLGRYRYDHSYQSRLQCVRRNLVLEYLIGLQEQTPRLQAVKRLSWSSRIMLSHDIDSLLHSAWPEMKTLARRLDLGLIWRYLYQEALMDRDNSIFERMLKMHDEAGTRAVFFWLASRKRHKTKAGRIIDNANYQIGSSAVRKLIRLTEMRGHITGVHQSLGCADVSAERRAVGPGAKINRNHYLAGPMAALWRQLDEAGIAIDATMGFSEAAGFRNSYGAPFRPFDLERGRLHQVLEVPLHVMDATLIKQGLTAAEAAEQTIALLSQHPTDCVLTVLWHNNYFSEIKHPGWAEAFRDILVFTRESGLSAIDPVETKRLFG